MTLNNMNPREFLNGFNTNYINDEGEPIFKKQGKAKKIVIKNENLLYIKKVKAYHCDFCGRHEVEVFESEFIGSEKGNNNDEMQICYECVKQLFKLIK